VTSSVFHCDSRRSPEDNMRFQNPLLILCICTRTREHVCVQRVCIPFILSPYLTQGIYVCTCVCKRAFMHACVCVCVHACVCERRHACTRVCLHMGKHVCCVCAGVPFIFTLYLSLCIHVCAHTHTVHFNVQSNVPFLATFHCSDQF